MIQVLFIIGIPASLFRLWWLWWTRATCPRCGEAPRECKGHGGGKGIFGP